MKIFKIFGLSVFFFYFSHLTTVLAAEHDEWPDLSDLSESEESYHPEPFNIKQVPFLVQLNASFPRPKYLLKGQKVTNPWKVFPKGRLCDFLLLHLFSSSNFQKHEDSISKIEKNIREHSEREAAASDPHTKELHAEKIVQLTIKKTEAIAYKATPKYQHEINQDSSINKAIFSYFHLFLVEYGLFELPNKEKISRHKLFYDKDLANVLDDISHLFTELSEPSLHAKGVSNNQVLLFLDKIRREEIQPMFELLAAEFIGMQLFRIDSHLGQEYQEIESSRSVSTEDINIHLIEDYYLSGKDMKKFTQIPEEKSPKKEPTSPIDRAFRAIEPLFHTICQGKTIELDDFGFIVKKYSKTLPKSVIEFLALYAIEQRKTVTLDDRDSSGGSSSDFSFISLNLKSYDSMTFFRKMAETASFDKDDKKFYKNLYSKRTVSWIKNEK